MNNYVLCVDRLFTCIGLLLFVQIFHDLSEDLIDTSLSHDLEIKVSDMYYGISWVIVIASLLLLIIGLRNADLALSEKGFYGMSYLLSLFGAITVQKNTRDIDVINNENEEEK